MPTKIGDPKPPTGFARLLFRAPIWLYRARLGWLLGRRFLLLNHTGRKSGLPRQSVLEVVDYDKESNTYFVASGWGKKSDWYRNIGKTPAVTIQVGLQKLAVTADRLSDEESGEAMADYARRHPTAARNLSRMVGYKVDGTEEDYRILGRDVVPFVALRPREL